MLFEAIYAHNLFIQTPPLLLNIPWRTMEASLRHIHGNICPLYRLIKLLIWLRNRLSHLHCYKYLCTFIRDMFDKKFCHIYFLKVSLNSKPKTQLLKHKILASYIPLALKTYQMNLIHQKWSKKMF